MAKPFYFKGLSELRGIGAITIVFGHMELYKISTGEPSFYNLLHTWPLIQSIGLNAIYLFFVLSGFLTTYILLKEQTRFGRIKLKKFYLRRMLRIAPLYYLVVGISFFILPLTLDQSFWMKEEFTQNVISNLHYGWNLVLYLSFLPDLARSIFPTVFGASQIWFVGVIVQFYLIWPIFIKIFRKNIAGAMLSVVIFKPLLIKTLIWTLGSSNPELMLFLRFLDRMKIEFMAMGGLLAWSFLTNPYIVRKFFRSKKRFGVLLGLLLVFMALHLSASINALLCTFLIGFLINLEWKNRFWKILGERSYGIFMYHVIIIYFSFSLVHQLFEDYGSVWIFGVEYALVFSLTYLVSSLSYRYFERYFFMLKSKFKTIPTKQKTKPPRF